MLPLGQKRIEKEKWSKRHEDIRLILRHLLEPLNKITKVPNLLSFHCVHFVRRIFRSTDRRDSR